MYVMNFLEIALLDTTVTYIKSECHSNECHCNFFCMLTLLESSALMRQMRLNAHRILQPMSDLRALDISVNVDNELEDIEVNNEIKKRLERFVNFLIIVCN